MGRVKYTDVTDEESKNRRNYQRGNVINFLDGDSLSQSNYGYGITTLVSDKSRVYKGGSWNDRAYWLSPGTRRFMEEDQASALLVSVVQWTVWEAQKVIKEKQVTGGRANVKNVKSFHFIILKAPSSLAGFFNLCLYICL